MKAVQTISIYVFLLGLISCQTSPSPIEGKWQVVSEFYKATYQIKKEAGSIVGKVLYYNDGTTHYKANGESNQYLFKDLSLEGNKYVDGVTGATSTKSEQAPQHTIELELLHEDTILAISYLMHQPIQETWIRK